jgi:hypothetical protein
MSEYCYTCNEILELVTNEMDDIDNCVKCQIKAAKIGVLNEVLEKIPESFTFPREVILVKIKEIEPVQTATLIGFEVGKTYDLKWDDRCRYHIISETHYVAVFKDGSMPTVNEIEYLGKKDDYEEYKGDRT